MLSLAGQTSVEAGGGNFGVGKPVEEKVPRSVPLPAEVQGSRCCLLCAGGAAACCAQGVPMPTGYKACCYLLCAGGANAIPGVDGCDFTCQEHAVSLSFWFC